MSILKITASIFFGILVVVVMPSIFPTPLVIGMSIATGLVLVILQTILILKNKTVHLDDMDEDEVTATKYFKG